MTEDLGRLTGALDTVAYLSRSANRVEVLDSLVDPGAESSESSQGCTRRELREMTGASQPTVSRILSEFEDRGWAERTTGGTYVATPFAEHLVHEFDPFLRSVDALQQFQEVVALLPTTELTIDRRHFADATIRRPEGPHPDDFQRYLSALVQEGSTSFYALTQAPGPAKTGSVVHELILAGELEYVLINPGQIHDYFREIPEARESAREQLDAGAAYYRHDGEIPCNLFVLDDVVVIENSRVDGIEDGTAIESRNETVRAWALELIERYRAESAKITVEGFS